MRSQGRGEHAMAEQRAVAAGARTGSSAGLAKSPWRGIGRRLSWSSQILPSGLDRPTSGHRRPFPHIRSAILKTSQPRVAKPTPQKSMTETTASSYFLHGEYGLRRRMASNKLFVRLSERQLTFSALRQGHHYAAGPSVGACFFRTIFCAFAPCPAANGPGACACQGTCITVRIAGTICARRELTCGLPHGSLVV
jgi:hypothetical protein